MGNLLPLWSKSSNLDLEQMRLVYRYAGVFVYSSIPVCLMVIGRLLMGSNDGDVRLAKTAGALLIADGLLGLLKQGLVLAELISGQLINRPGVAVTQSTIGALLICTAMILIALYYGEKKMLGWAIAGTVFKIVFVSALSTFHLTGNTSAATVFGICSVGVLVCEVVYYVKWCKLLKRQNA